MNGPTASAFLSIGFFAALGQFAAGLLSHPSGIVFGGVIAVASLSAVRFFEIELGQVASVLLPSLSSAIGIACLAFVPGRQAPILWMAPLLACSMSAIAVWIRQLSSERCALCSRRLRGGGVAFKCPRCGLRVCDNCWVFEFQRCRLCEQNRVPIFTDSRWWDRELGPRLTFGRCQFCLTPAEAEGADLRACRNCGRPQCRACWDASNGECRRCGWIVEDLPPSLRPYVGAVRPSANSRAARSGP